MMHSSLPSASSDTVEQEVSPDAEVATGVPEKLSGSYRFVGTAGWRVPQLVAVIRTASLFTADLHIRKGARKANGKSYLELLTLGIRFGDRLTIHASGRAASEALLAVAALPFFAPLD